MDLLPISEVAAGFRPPISTLHYWERCGLLTPHRRSGRRCYDRDQLYRIALLKVWRETGNLSLDDIAAALGVRHTDRGWRTRRVPALPQGRAPARGQRLDALTRPRRVSRQGPEKPRHAPAQPHPRPQSERRDGRPFTAVQVNCPLPGNDQPG
ncbi:MerR family transcriptional regulator [Amycolatopsis saalfeldensis]|nr:MerR family transcriptional regulator [Amycolatopsis saalfeldensis]